MSGQFEMRRKAAGTCREFPCTPHPFPPVVFLSAGGGIDLAVGHAEFQFPDQGSNLRPLALEAQSLNHWATRKIFHHHLPAPPIVNILQKRETFVTANELN